MTTICSDVAPRNPCQHRSCGKLNICKFGDFNIEIGSRGYSSSYSYLPMMSTNKISLLLSGSMRFSAQNAVAKNLWTTSIVGEPPKPSMSVNVPERPKRPASPYMIFALQCGKNMGGTITDKAKESSRQWREMSEDAKRPYFHQFETEKKNYDKTKKKFLAQLEKSGQMELYKASEVMARSETRIKKLKKEVQRLEEEMNKPKSVPKSPFAIFMAEEYKGLQGSFVEKSRALGEKWRILSSEQKRIYEDKLNAMQSEREKNMAAWEKKNMSSEKMTELEKAMASLKMAKSKKRSAASVLKESTN